MSEQIEVNNPKDPAAPAPQDPPPVPDPQQGADPPDPAVELENLKQQLETERSDRLAAEKAKISAENAIKHTKSELAKLKDEQRLQLTAEQQLEERLKEVEAEKAELRVLKNMASAKGILAELNLSEKEMSEDELALLVSDSEEQTTALSRWVKSLVQSRETRAAKLEREKVLKEMPQPPAGDKGEPEDPFLQGFNQGYSGHGGRQRK